LTIVGAKGDQIKEVVTTLRKNGSAADPGERAPDMDLT
jgi:hypothetical protein